MKVEIGFFRDRRLKVIGRFRECKNFWKHEDGSYTYVFTLEDIELLSRTLRAIDYLNKKINS